MVKPSELKEEAMHQGINSAVPEHRAPFPIICSKLPFFFFTVRNDSSLTVQSLNLRLPVHETQHAKQHLAGTKGSKQTAL